MRVWLAVPRLIFFLHPQCAFFACRGLVLSRGSLTLLQVCSLFMDWVFYPFPFFSGLFCCVFPCPDSLAWLCLCGGACGGVLPRWPSFHWPALLSLGHWGVLVLRILGFEFLELCSSSRSLPVVTGSRSFLACWGLPVPLRLGVCLLHLLIPCGFPWWFFFAFVLDFGVPLVWLCLCLLWVRLHVPFLSVTLSGSVVGLFHLSACQVVCVPCLFPGSAVFLCCSWLRYLVSWGCMLILLDWMLLLPEVLPS